MNTQIDININGPAHLYTATFELFSSGDLEEIQVETPHKLKQNFSTKAARFCVISKEQVDDENSSEPLPLQELMKCDLADRMIFYMKLDLEKESLMAPDLFNFVDDDKELNRLDAIIWMYDLYPKPVELSFSWVCEHSTDDLDELTMRSSFARYLRDDFIKVLRLLDSIVGRDYALYCELVLADYINLTGWEK